jgi:hypothetical protein
MKYFLYIFFLTLGYVAHAQAILNDYKYVIVPKQFEGFRSANQYQTSTMVKYYLVNEGFNAVYDDALPDELNSRRCLALVTSLERESSMFTTGVAIIFKDCEGKERYRTRTGSSKAKEYPAAYREAIAEAFESFKGFEYSYTPKETYQPPVVINFKDDVKELPPPAAAAVAAEEKAEEAFVKGSEQAGDKEGPMALSSPVERTESVTLEDAVADARDTQVAPGKTLYAQQTETGYQLVDTAPSIQFYLEESSIPNLFIAERKGQHGVLFLNNGKWIFEYYEAGDRIQEIIAIKF